MSIRCPVCGANIRPESVPPVRNSSFQCSRCRTQLDVAASDPIPGIAVSAFLAIGLCFALGMRGFVLIFAIVGVTALIYWLLQFVRSCVAAPKLQRSQSGDKLPHLSKRIYSAR
jgi:hypothetical protein